MEKIEGLGKRLKELREMRGLTIEMVVYDMNHRFGVKLSKGHISKWENEVNVPSLAHTRRLCMYYQVNLDYLLGLAETKAPVRVLAKEDDKKKKEEEEDGNI